MSAARLLEQARFHAFNTTDFFGGLILGAYKEDGTLHFCGTVGTGFDRKMIEEIYDRLQIAVRLLDGELPIEDIWSNLLLVLAVEPDEFFRVANNRGIRRRPTRGTPDRA